MCPFEGGLANCVQWQKLESQESQKHPSSFQRVSEKKAWRDSPNLIICQPKHVSAVISGDYVSAAHRPNLCDTTMIMIRFLAGRSLALSSTLR